MTDHALFREANDPDTPPNRLRQLSKHPSESIRAAVALNQSTNSETLLSLVGDSSTHVFENLMAAKSDFLPDSYDFTATKNTKLSLAQVGDAEFILSLRLDPSLNKYLSQVDDSLDQQREWLRTYKKRQARRSEFYFIIKDLDDDRLGTVRLYDFQPGSFCWGSWIVKPGSPRKTAFESALNVYEFAFSVLGFSASHFDVRNDNDKVIKFHERMGARIVRSDSLDTYFVFDKEKYEITKDSYEQFLAPKFERETRSQATGT